MRLIGYIRVSTDQQDLGPEVQRQGIERAAAGRELIIFEDRIGGGLDVEKREGLADALAELRRGDEFIVYKLDRLARDLMLQLIIEKRIKDKGCRLVSCQDEGTEGEDSPQKELIRQILAVFAQFERSLIKQRTREALRIKKQQGVKLGAPVKDYNDIDFSKGWEGSGLSRSSFYKAKKRRECKSV